MKIRKSTFIAALASALCVSISCTDNFKEVPTATGNTIVQVAAGNNNFNILAAALTKTGLVNTLNNNNSGSFTVFAPTDDAFVNYWRAVRSNPALTEQNVLDTIANLKPTAASSPNIGALTGVLNYHIVNSRISSAQVAGSQAFSSLGTVVVNNVTFPTRLSLSKQGSTILINAGRAVENSAANGATISTTIVDVPASNGVIHGIDRVLIPITAAGNTTAAAFFGLTVNYATNPPTIGGGTTSNNTSGTNYDLLAAALRVTGLAPAILPNTNPLPDFTIFAPTDAAFVSFLLNGAAYSAANETAAYNAINGLSATSTPSLATVTDLLRYHVVPGRVLSTDLTTGMVVNTALAGKTFTILSAAGPVTINDQNTTIVAPNADATVSSANILTNAGVIHQISAVLQPN